MTVTEYLRARLLEPVVMAEKVGLKPPLSELMDGQWNPEFERYMRNRLIMGRMRYGGDMKTGEGMVGFPYADSAEERLRLYRDTGNGEHLVDAANFCMLEFTFPSRPGFHFQAMDDGPHGDGSGHTIKTH